MSPEPSVDLERRVREQEALLEIGLELAATLDLRRVLSLALTKAEEFCRAETSSIWEVDEAAGDLFFRVVRGRAAPEIENLRIPIGQGIVGAVAASGRVETINDVASDPRWRGDASEQFDTRAILAVPLTARGKVIGVLQLLNPVGKEAFSAGDVRRMQLFAGPLAHALENARLYAAQQRLFVETVTALAEAVEKRDPYTGGHLHRVVAYSLLLGRELGLDSEALEGLALGATLHDIGKIGVPDQVLLKPGKLERRGGGGDAPPPGGRRRDRVADRIARRNPADRAQPPRADRRPRLPRRPRGRGDSARGADRRRGGHLRRHDHQPPLPSGAWPTTIAAQEIVEACRRAALRDRRRGFRASFRRRPLSRRGGRAVGSYLVGENRARVQ